MASIELDKVSKVYANGAHGVREIDLTIEDGEFMIFLGPRAVESPPRCA